jgi:serine protease Do
MRTTNKKLAGIVLAAAVGGAIAWTTTGRGFDQETPAKRNGKGAPVEVSEAPPSRDARLNTSFAPIVKKVGPSIVNIFTTKTVKNPYGSELSPFFRRFFGDRFDDENPQDSPRQPRTFKERSLGSGVIVSKEGHILTNNHVVDSADEVQVALAQGRKQYTAKVVGKDPQSDLAVLKIEAKDLPAITLADSDKIEVGDLVLAIGNPFGLGQTVTMGIVGATGRGGMGIEAYEDFIQTDAAINPGNSGGALIDVDGRLIGINTAILSRSGGNQGVGFAIPVNMARNVMDQLIKTGTVSRGMIGVYPQDLNPELEQEFKVGEQGGALVARVSANSPAEEAGIKSGDVIVEVDGKPVRDSRNLRLIVGSLPPGTKADVKVLRQGKEKTFTVKLKEMPQQKLASGRGELPDTDTDALNGVEVGDLTPAARSKYRIPADVKGALITNIDPDSASYEKGLRTGDVIEEINRQPVTNAQEAVDASNRAKDKSVLVRIWSHGGSRFEVIDESKK